MLKILHNIKMVDGMLLMGIILIAAGIGLSIKDSYFQETKVEVISKGGGVLSGDVQVDSKVTIDVGGEVEKPGVYELKNGDRIGDVLTMAGGLSANADRQWVERNLNRAERLLDGQKIYIPKKDELISNDQFLISNKDKKISLNNADESELDKLTGIGPSMAKKIIEYRETYGGFKSVEEIKLVSGIGDKLFEKIKDEIKL